MELPEVMELAEQEERAKQLRKEGASYGDITKELGITYDQAYGLVEGEFMQASVAGLVRFAWINSSTSQNYESDRWKDFDEVVDRLNSPNMVYVYIKDCIPYSFERSLYLRTSPNLRSPTMTPEEVFEKKYATCDDQSRIAQYCLIRNGYTYNDFDKYPDKAAVILQARNDRAGSSPSGSHGHTTCLYIENGKFYLIDDKRIERSQSLIKGPYNTIEEAADVTYPDPGWNEYRFYDINMRLTKTVYRK
jgi:hypothetical protein